MNGLDLGILILLALAGWRGFRHGFIVELASLLALVAGLWAAARHSAEVAAATGIGADEPALGFLIVFVAVLVGVHLLARLITSAIDLVELGLPNRLSGALFAMVRSAFTLSVLLNLLLGYSEGTMPPAALREGSALHSPLRAFAPVLVPAVGETKWVQWAVERIREEAGGVPAEPAP